MKLTLRYAAIFAGLLVGGLGLQAQFIWSGSSVTNGLVTDSTNWQGGITPGGSSGTEDISFGDMAGTQTNVLVPTSVINNLVFNGIDRPTFTFSGSGPTPELTLNGDVTVGPGCPVLFDNTLALTLATGTHTVNVSSSSALQVAGAIGGAGNLVKVGYGDLILTGTNTFFGETTVSFGTLQVYGGSISHSGTNTNVGSATGDDGVLLISNGGSVTDDWGYIAANSGALGTVTVTGPGSSWMNYGYLVVGNFGIGTLVIINGGYVNCGPSQIGSGSGGFGTVVISGISSSLNTADALVGGVGTGTLTLANGGIISVAGGSGSITLGWTGAGALNIGAASGDTAAAGGFVNAATITTASGSGVLQFNTTASSTDPYYLTKDGTVVGVPVAIGGPTSVVNQSGYNVLSGVNTYTGSTTINGGTLVAGNDSALGTGTVTLNNLATLNLASGTTLANPIVFGTGGTLSGNGAFGTPISVGANAVLSPGNSPGTLSFTAGLTLAPGGTLNFEVQSAAGPAGTGYDLLSVSGAVLDISATSGTPFTLRLISLNAGGTAGNVADFSSAGSYTWTIATSAAGITNFSASSFTIDTSAFTNPLGVGSFSITQGLSGGNPALLLNFTPVPEPSTCALMGAGLSLVLFGGVRRRRRKLGQS